MNEQLLSDKPITLRKEDRFQRFNFSQRIARTIIQRKSEDCIVIGIYGAWGEGKTSVLNFIEAELKENGDVIIIKFNPWRYSDENSLLIQFFQQLANALKISLKTKKEKAGDLLYKYGKHLKIDIPGLGNIGENMQSVGEALAEVDVETLKSRISEIIKENNSKIVVFIDDIDRLDKTEIHSIFRLVKLTGDFSNTTYILSFDEQMVASAIGERFSEGNKKAGQSFLEKIIQVPLQIPFAQSEALKEFCFNLIEKSLDSNSIALDEINNKRFVKEFDNAILIKLDTPRLAVRYGNSLSFSLPLLNGEVNIVDLMLIEAIKIFYPNFYEFIKLNPEFFIGGYSDHFVRETNKEKIKEIFEHLNTLSKNLTQRQSISIQNLLRELFPRLNEAFGNYYHSVDNELEWFKSKRIVSTKYFNRYFSYAVIKGDISDVVFQNIISSICFQEESLNIASIRELVSETSPVTFLQKIRSIEDDFSSEISLRLAKALSKCSEIFPATTNAHFILGYGSPKYQAAFFISKLIKKNIDKQEFLELPKELIKSIAPFDFAFELYNCFKYEKDFKIEDDLLDRAKKEAGEIPLFEKFPEYSYMLYAAWAKKDKKDLISQTESMLKKKPSLSIDLLNSIPAFTQSNAFAPYQRNFIKEDYEYIAKTFDKEIIKKYLINIYGVEVLYKSTIKWEQSSGPFQDKLNIAKQFIHWDNESLSNYPPNQTTELPIGPI